MKKKNEIIKQFKNLLTEIKIHNKHYFIDDSPKINDQEYDLLKKKLELLEKNYSYLKTIGSVKNIVGSHPLNKFKKIEHLSPMLSLSNAFDKSDMVDFQKKINNFINAQNKDIEFFCEPKIDGISATLIYEKGNLKRGLSRGDGRIGEDILENLKTISDLPKQINQK